MSRSLQEMQEVARAILGMEVTSKNELRQAANELLDSASLCRSLEPEQRSALFLTLFPHKSVFSSGFLAVASSGEVPDDVFAQAIMGRATAIDTVAKAKKERPFLTWLLTPAKRSNEAIRRVLSSVQLIQLVEMVNRHAPDLARTHRIVLLSWRTASENRRWR